MKRIVMLVPYFGKWPEWINLYIETCKWNPTIDWLFLTDCKEPENKCVNVRYIHTTLNNLNELASSRLGMKIALPKPVKVCDLRPAFGTIFNQQIKDYDYFGFGDIDVFYGNIRKFLNDELLCYDLISFHGMRISEHFLLLRNCPTTREVYKITPGWKDKINASRHWALDDDIGIVIDKERSYYRESFSTPYMVGCIPWVDGTFIYPTEWYWNKGVLTNNRGLDTEFPYFHFMVWKGGYNGGSFGGGQWEKLQRIVHLDYKNAPCGWKINEKGIFPVEDSPQEYLLREKTRLILLRRASIMKKIQTMPFMRGILGCIYSIYIRIANLKTRIRLSRTFSRFFCRK